MLGKHEVRTALAVLGAGAAIAGFAIVGPSADAELVTVDGLATGIEGEVTYPAEEVDGDPIVETIEPTPNVLLPAEGTPEDEAVEDIVGFFQIEDVLDVQGMVVGTQGSLGDSEFRGAVFSDTTIDNLFVRDVIQADTIRSGCALHEGGLSALSVDFEEVTIDGTEIEASPDPNTEIEVPDFGTVFLNVQEEAEDHVEVTAMQIDFEVEAGPSGVLRIGISECGKEEVQEIAGEQFVPQSDLADPFEGDPEFTG